MKKILLIIGYLCMLNVYALYAQTCPTTPTATVAVTPANCPSSGTATITTNIPVELATYTITSGPQGVNIPQNSNVFNGLAAGNYSVRVDCAEGSSISTNFTIANNYNMINTVLSTESYTCTQGNYTGNP